MTKNLRRNEAEKYEFKDGHTYGAYQVYDDGKVTASHGLLESFRSLNSDYQALREFMKWSADYALNREQEMQARVRRFWQAAERDMQKVAKVAEPETFTLSLDERSGELTRVKKPAPAAKLETD